MRRLLTFLLAALCFVACTQNEVEELTANRADVPETLTVGFEGGDTRIELNEALKTVWSKGDLASVFYKSDANQKWQYQGETGERLGTLKCVDAGTATTRTDLVVVAYPYNTNYILNRTNGNIEASLPAVQSYKEGSYGSEGNIMVAQSEFTQFSLKSVVGWLRVELTGEGQKVKSITLRGNAEEQVAGLIYVDTATAEATLATEMGEASDEEQVGGVGGGLEFDDTVFTEVTLNCGEGVELGSEAKSFYIALLPQTFEQGITIEVESIGYENMTMTTTEAITIKRNHIKPMQTQEYNGEVYQIYDLAYATNDGKAINPFTIEGFGAEFDENIYDASTGKGILRFKGSITTIPAQAFGLCENLTWIDIPEGITTIGTSAFTGCSALEEITIPASVTDVGNEAFKNCPCKATINCDNVSFGGAGFTEVTIGDSVTTIGEGAFDSCVSLTSVTIGNSVTTIGYEAFRYCSSLTSVTIPDSVTLIGTSAFSSCDSLTSVTIGNSVTTIGETAFYWCESLTSVYCKATTPPTLGSNVFKTYNNGYVNIGCPIYVPEGSLREYKMAENWSEYADCFVGYDFETGEEVGISNKLFYTATALVKPNNTSAFNVAIVSNEWDEATGEGVITFDGELTTIGDEAFVECHSLTSVTIPDSVTAIGYMAFYDCNSLTIVTIPDSVTTIGEGAFAECHSLTSVTIPDSVTTIGYGAFALCHSLAEFKGEFAADGGRCLIKDNAIIAYAEASGTEYTIPDSVTTIGDGVFDGCESLTSVTIPDSVTTIGACAFYDCIGLTSVIIPDSVTTIGNYAFAYCDDLTSVYCKAPTPPTLGFYVFDDNASGRKIYVTAESVEAYKAAENWSEYAADIVGYDFE